MNERILIAGCGDVGNALATRLLADGCEVWGVRRRVDALAPGVSPWRIDLRDAANAGPPPAAFDYLFYTASADRRDEEAYRAIYVDALRILLGVLRDAGCPLQRVFFTSSTAVLSPLSSSSTPAKPKPSSTTRPRLASMSDSPASTDREEHDWSARCGMAKRPPLAGGRIAFTSTIARPSYTT